MKLSFLKEVPLETLRKNVEYNLKNYSFNTNDWIYSFFDDKNPFLELNKDFQPFTLVTNEEKSSKTDIENIKILYSALKDLSVIEASNENLWASLAHNELWNYMKYRLSLDKKEYSADYILKNFFFFYDKRKSLIFHPLSRLWWTGYLVYDENRENPFELLEVFKTDYRTKLLYLFSSNFSNNKKITNALLSSIYNFEKSGMKINSNLFNKIIIYLNILGGTYILDYFEKFELEEKITNKINSLLLEE